MTDAKPGAKPDAKPGAKPDAKPDAKPTSPEIEVIKIRDFRDYEGSLQQSLVMHEPTRQCRLVLASDFAKYGGNKQELPGRFRLPQADFDRLLSPESFGYRFPVDSLIGTIDETLWRRGVVLRNTTLTPDDIQAVVNDVTGLLRKTLES